MLLQHALYNRQTDTAAQLGALVGLVALADAVVSVPDVRQILRRDTIAVVDYLKSHKPRLLAEKPHYDGIVVTGVGHGVVYQIEYHLLQLGDIGADHYPVLGVKLNYDTVVVPQDIKPRNDPGKLLGNVEHRHVHFGNARLQFRQV